MMIQHTLSDLMQSLLFQPPAAIAIVKGSAKYPNIQGEVCFFRTPEGTMVVADIKGLPEKAEKCTEGIYGFHIHEGESCTGTAEDPFADAKSHLNPKKCPHPYHAGDMPPLFGNKGHARMAFLTDRFTIDEILGRVVIVHDKPDDFTSQPSGNAGQKIACGRIEKGF